MREIIYSNPRHSSGIERNETLAKKKSAAENQQTLPGTPPADPVLTPKQQQLAQRMEWEKQITADIHTCQEALCKATTDEKTAEDNYKATKTVRKKLTTDLMGLQKQLNNPKGHLPLSTTPPLKGQKELPLPTGPDEYGMKPIGHLSIKDIKRINPKAFEEAAAKKEPIGLTDKVIENFAGHNINTVKDVEEFLARGNFAKHVSGVGDNMRDRIQDTVLAYRAVYPIPPEAEKPADGKTAAAGK